MNLSLLGMLSPSRSSLFSERFSFTSQVILRVFCFAVLFVCHYCMADPFQNDFPEVVDDILEHRAAICVAFNRRGTLLAGERVLSASSILSG